MFRIENQCVPESSGSFTNSVAVESGCFLSLSISTSSVGTTFLLRYQINTYFSEHTVAGSERMSWSNLAFRSSCGLAVEGLASVSVVAGSCLVAGTASTLGILMGVDAG